MVNYFSFAGKRCVDFGMFVEAYPSQPKPQRKVELLTIPGRNGSLRIDQGAWENVRVSYDCYFRGGPEKASAIAGWLYGSSAGYGTLRDTYHPGVFRLAAFDGPVDIENALNRYGRCRLTFDCKPQLFLDQGENRITLGSAGNPTSIHNPWYPAHPLITVYAAAGVAGDRTLAVNGCTVTIKNFVNPITLDCDVCDAYYATSEKNYNMNAYVSALEYPVLSPGENQISWSAGISRVDITPRWWKL